MQRTQADVTLMERTCYASHEHAMRTRCKPDFLVYEPHATYRTAMHNEMSDDTKAAHVARAHATNTNHARAPYTKISITLVFWLRRGGHCSRI